MATTDSMRESIDSLIERLHESASVASVFGDPIERDGKTVVPVARIAYGFGGGFDADTDEPETSEGGGGGGVAATPAGALEITETDTRFVRFADRKKLVGAVVAGILLGLLLGRRRGG